MNYAGTGLTVDTRLQQNPTTWITAKGYVPAALFKAASSAERERGARRDGRAGRSHRSARRQQADRSRPRAGLHDRADQRHRHGAGEDRRHRLGRRSASDRRRHASTRRRSRSSRPASATPTSRARSTCSRTGCTSTHITVLDNHQSPLSITGDLAVHERQVGGVEIYVHARRLQGDRQQDGQRPGQQRPGDRRRAARAARRGRPRRHDRPRSISIQILALVGDSAVRDRARPSIVTHGRMTRAGAAGRRAVAVRRAGDGRPPHGAGRSGRQGERAAGRRARRSASAR